MQVYLGSAIQDGRQFKQWFVGDLQAWAQQAGSAFSGSPLHQTQHIEVKWGMHGKGEQRAGWSTPSAKVSMSILIHGQFQLTFRQPESSESSITYVLEKEGDYLLWSEQLPHTWLAKEDSTILTIRWPAE